MLEQVTTGIVRVCTQWGEKERGRRRKCQQKKNTLLWLRYELADSVSRAPCQFKIQHRTQNLSNRTLELVDSDIKSLASDVSPDYFSFAFVSGLLRCFANNFVTVAAKRFVFHSFNWSCRFVLRLGNKMIIDQELTELLFSSLCTSDFAWKTFCFCCS